MNVTRYERIGESVSRKKLDNGLELRVVRRPGYARKYAFFATRYGGMDTRFQLNGQWLDTPPGIAHYLEHKMFDTEDGNALQDLAKNGAEPNAFTSNAMTGYYFDSTGHFDENLEILLSFVSIPYFTKESVDKEQGIIAQEIRMIEDNPDWRIYHDMANALYSRNTARTAIAGTVESIREITAETLYRCHEAFYTPSNMILTVVGDVEPERVEEIATRILPKTSGPVIPRDYGQEPEEVAEHESKRVMEVATPQFLTGFKCRPSPDGDAWFRQALIGELASDILLGESSPLYLKLYDDGLINTTFGGDYELLPGYACFYAGGDSRDARAVTDAILKEAARLGAGEIDPDFYERVRRSIYGAYIRSFNSFETIAVSMTEGYFHGYDPFRFPEVFETVTPDDVSAFLRENITAERCVLSEILPA
ncbi:MAG: insulinase family protein [Oscillospiraceae bacterium]|nr:insulinase family protein [Oscillospiraceae bacterium]